MRRNAAVLTGEQTCFIVFREELAPVTTRLLRVMRIEAHQRGLCAGLRQQFGVITLVDLEELRVELRRRAISLALAKLRDHVLDDVLFSHGK